MGISNPRNSDEPEERFSIRLPDGMISGTKRQLRIRSASDELNLDEPEPDLLAAQLSYFLARVRQRQGFGDQVESHLAVMRVMGAVLSAVVGRRIIKSL